MQFNNNVAHSGSFKFSVNMSSGISFGVLVFKLYSLASWMLHLHGTRLPHIFKIPSISNEKPSISIEIPSISIENLGFRSKY